MFKLLTFASLLYCACYGRGAAGQPNSDSDCQSVIAERRKPLVLNGCHRYPRRWFNITGGAHVEIHTGIHDVTGGLEVTAFASSVVGGQQYECMCGNEPRCYKIHIPPLIDIKIIPRNVTVGGSVSVTCSATEGYPIPKDIKLISSHHVMTVENGHPHVFHNVQLEDGGVLTCELDGVSTQPSKGAPLNVHELSVENATVPGNNRSTATIGCLVGHSNKSITVKFFKNGDEIPVDGHKFTPSSYPYGNMTHGHYLMVRNVIAADVGAYECRVFTNDSRQEQIASREVFIETWLPKCTVTTENGQLEGWLIGLIVALFVVILVAVTGWAAFFWKIKTKGTLTQQNVNGEGRA